MNAVVARALLLDAFYQVVDNKIFRLLLLMVGLIVLLTFAIGIGPERISILFGAWTLEYDALTRAFGSAIPPGVDLQGAVIQELQSLLVETLCGSVGMTVCLAATAFFVPRMLEKGAADTVFSKPVSRWALLFSRYVAGLIFVGILSVVLIGGVWLGGLVSSGWSDPGFLWGIVTLVYLFGVLHAFSLAVGVITRSTVAAILVSVLVFFFSGCVHSGWVLMHWMEDPQIAERMRELPSRNGPVRVETDSSGGDSDSADSVSAADEPENPVVTAFKGALGAVHYVLPKTSDADVLTAKLRKALERAPPQLEDETAQITFAPQGDLERVAPPGEERKVDLSATKAVWVERSGETEVARHEVARRSRVVPGEPGKKPRKLSASQAAKDIAKRLEATAGTVRVEDAFIAGSFTPVLRWEEGERWHSIHVLTSGDWVLEIHSDVPAITGETRSKDKEPERIARFVGGIAFVRGAEMLDPEAWYRKRFSLSAPLKFNVAFSIGSTLCFTALMLLVAWWKLRRIDF